MKRTFAIALALLVAVAAATAAPAVKLVYWSMWNQTEPQAQVLEAAIRDFEAKNAGVKVEINWNGREIRKTLQPALDNKQVIDLWDEDTERVVKTWGAYALKLDAYLAKSYPSTGGKAYKDAVMGSLLNLSRSYAADKGLYAVPYQPFVFAFMYNKEHFDKAGIKAAPKTWDELLAAMAKLKAAGFTPMTVDDAYMDTLPGYYLARAKGYPWVEQLVKDKTNAMWSDPAVLQMAKAFENLAKSGYLSKTVAGNKWPAGQQDVAAGDVTMYLNGTWLVNEIMGSTGPDFKWGTFSFPTVPGGKDDQTAANFGAQAFQINKNCKNPDVAFALIAHLTTGKWDAELAKKSYGVPVGGTTDWPVQLAEAKAIFNNLKTCYPWAAGIQANVDKLPVISENFTKLVGGTITAEQFVAAMKK
ncbi:MAG: extracellular solute-binding protein [Spirochaetaceae bacterium]|nr:extracellular solute-binding protein [Spirochaetaceae bacterium]